MKYKAIMAIVSVAVLVCTFRADPVYGEEAAYQRHRAQVYAKRGDKVLRAEVYVPRGEGPFPAVLVVHGGSWRSGNRYQLRTVSVQLAQRGYTTVAIDYRLAPKYPFPAQIEDCQDAVRWMKSNAKKFNLDPNRVGGFGYSAGGQLVALLGVTRSDEDKKISRTKKDERAEADPSPYLQAVVAGGAPCDFTILPPKNRLLAYWLGGSRADRPTAYRQASPLSFVSPTSSPMFFFHGEKDGKVPILSPRSMVKQLRKVHVQAELHIVRGAGHFKAMLDKKTITAAFVFLDSVLKPDPPKTDNNKAKEGED